MNNAKTIAQIAETMADFRSVSKVTTYAGWLARTSRLTDVRGLLADITAEQLVYISNNVEEFTGIEERVDLLMEVCETYRLLDTELLTLMSGLTGTRHVIG